MNPYQLKAPVVVDLYQEEHPVDWASMNPLPYRALLQCTKGQFHADIRCEEFIQQCNELGIKYGLYHFLLPNNIDEQVDIFTTTVDKLGGLGHFPPVVDVEYKPPKQKPGHPDNFPRGKHWASQVKAFLDAIEAIDAWGNQKPVIYTNLSFWEFTFDHDIPPEWSSDYPLWVAWYPNKKYIDKNQSPLDSRMPKGWTKWALWQYSQSGRSDGYLANDYSIVADDFRARLDAQFP